MELVVRQLLLVALRDERSTGRYNNALRDGYVACHEADTVKGASVNNAPSCFSMRKVYYWNKRANLCRRSTLTRPMRI